MFLMAGGVQLEASQLYVTITSHTEMHTRLFLTLL
jgi:hypothetical protein